MKFQKVINLMMVAAVLFAAISSCDKENDDDIILGGGGSKPVTPTPSPDPDPDPEPTPSSTDSYTSRIEVPALKDGNLFIQHSTTENGKSVMNYCLEYDTKMLHSRWVAFRFDAVTRAKNVGRQDSFQEDPDLPSQYQHGFGGFGSGYDRGHLCASADRLYSSDANMQTFYMTNMSPQMSRFNQDYWVGFEGKVQSWGRSASFADTLYVCKGGTIEDDQILGYRDRNGKKVAVPKYYFMAILQCKNNTYKALAFLMEHKDYQIKDPSNAEMATKIVSIDSLEKVTGIDFFHNLPDAVENVVEASVSPSAWGFSSSSARCTCRSWTTFRCSAR